MTENYPSIHSSHKANQAGLVSIIIPVFNCAQYIEQAISSALRQTYKSIEIIIVDDGSDDDLLEVLSPYKESVRYFYQNNKGVSAARNLGISQAQGEFIAFLDADDEWKPTKIATQVKVLKENTEIGLIHTAVEFINAQGKTVNPHTENFPRKLAGAQCLHELFRDGNAMCTSSVMVRKACFTDTICFPSGIDYAEDYAVWLEISVRWGIAFIKDKLTRYRLHANPSLVACSRHRAAELNVLQNIAIRYSHLLDTKQTKIRLATLAIDAAKLAYSEGKIMFIYYATVAVMHYPSWVFMMMIPPRQRNTLAWYGKRIRNWFIHIRTIHSGRD